MIVDDSHNSTVWVSAVRTYGKCARVTESDIEYFDACLNGRYGQTRFASRMRHLHNDPNIICLDVSYKTFKYLVHKKDLDAIALKVE